MFRCHVHRCVLQHESFEEKHTIDMKTRVYRLLVPCFDCGFFLKQKTPSLHVRTQGVCIAHVGQTRKNWFMW